MTNLLTTISFVIHVENTNPPMSIGVYILTQRENAVDTGKATRVISVVITERASQNEAGFDY